MQSLAEYQRFGSTPIAPAPILEVDDSRKVEIELEEETGWGPWPVAKVWVRWMGTYRLSSRHEPDGAGGWDSEGPWTA